MTKRNGIILAMALCIGAVFNSCQKAANDEIKVDQTTELATQMTLAEFLDSDEVQDLKSAFTGPVIDNSALAINTESASQRDGGRPMRVFRGFWTTDEANGTGYCWGHVISYCGSMNGEGLIPDPNYRGGLARVHAPTTIKISFDNEDTGFTGDGFLPLNHDISIDPSLANELGLAEGAYIVAGTYVANFDPEVGYHNSVIVDINW